MTALPVVLTNVDPRANARARVRALFGDFIRTIEGGRPDHTGEAYTILREELERAERKFPGMHALSEYQRVVMVAYSYGMMQGNLEADELEVNYG